MLIWPQKAVPPAVPPSPLPRASQGRNARARAGHVATFSETWSALSAQSVLYRISSGQVAGLAPLRGGPILQRAPGFVNLQGVATERGE